MKKIIAILAVLSASSAFGQCPTGNCARVYYAPIMPRYQTVQPCQAVQQVAPCQAQPVAEPEACAPVATIEPCAPVETCATETCEPSAESVLKIKDECVGACPLRSAAKAAVKTATAPVRAVANLLASANATRARYGLPALQYDESLTVGANYGANYCARAGQVCHVPGCGYEIVAMNGQGIETAVNQWLDSPPHRALLLNGRFRYAGVSVVRDRHGRAWCSMRFR